jgi:hypothetical protein
MHSSGMLSAFIWHGLAAALTCPDAWIRPSLAATLSPLEDDREEPNAIQTQPAAGRDQVAIAILTSEFRGKYRCIVLSS